MCLRILFLLPVIFLISCARQEVEQEGPTIFGDWMLTAIKGEGGQGGSTQPPPFTPNLTVFTFHKDRTISISEDGYIKTISDGNLMFDNNKEQMITYHEQVNGRCAGCRSRYVLEESRMFYKTPEGYILYFKRP